MPLWLIALALGAGGYYLYTKQKSASGGSVKDAKAKGAWSGDTAGHQVYLDVKDRSWTRMASDDTLNSIWMSSTGLKWTIPMEVDNATVTADYIGQQLDNAS